MGVFAPGAAAPLATLIEERLEPVTVACAGADRGGRNNRSADHVDAQISIHNSPPCGCCARRRSHSDVRLDHSHRLQLAGGPHTAQMPRRRPAVSAKTRPGNAPEGTRHTALKISARCQLAGLGIRSWMKPHCRIALIQLPVSCRGQRMNASLECRRLAPICLARSARLNTLLGKRPAILRYQHHTTPQHYTPHE